MADSGQFNGIHIHPSHVAFFGSAAPDFRFFPVGIAYK
jgi:hypothetical protein